MALPGLFTAHSVKIQTIADAINIWIDQVQDSDVDPGLDVIEESGSGETDREYTAIRGRAPVLKINTSDVGVISTVGLNGAAITCALNKPGLVAYGKFISNLGTRDAIASATHLKLALTDGLIIPETLQAGHNQVARLSLAAHAMLGSTPTYSGTYPITFTKDQQISSGGITSVNRYVAGVVKYTINGGASKLVTGIMQMSINFGIQLFKESSDGEVDITYIAIKERKPMLEFQTFDGELLDDVGEGGLDLSAMTFYFQKLSPNGERVSKATGAHVSIAATSGLLIPKSQSVPHNQAGKGSYSFMPVKNTNLFTIATNATIPTS